MSNRNVNKVILLGNIGHDPELRFTGKGNPVLSLSLATSRDIKSEEGVWREETQWHRATVWGKRAETCSKYLRKGSRVFVEGEIQSKKWTDKEGNPRFSTEVMVEDIKFLSEVTKNSQETPENFATIEQ